MDDDRLIEAAVVDPEDREFDVALRPTSLADFVGQERVKEQLQLLIDGARRRGEPVDHLLFSGPPGLGKTTLAQIVANAMGAGFPADERAGARPAQRPRRDPHEPGRRRRVVRRRGASHAAAGRGGAVPGARGLRARRRARQGSDRAVDPPRAAEVHARRRDDPAGAHHASAPGTVRVLAPARLLPGRRPRSHRRAVGRHPRGPARRGGRRRDRAAVARHAAHREPAAAAGARLRRGATRRRDHG